jgi:probable rRNA maturation factor
MHDAHNISVQYAVAADGMPDEDAIRQWATLALQAGREDAELSVRVVDTAEITALNRQYRGKDGATNVLSFPFEEMTGVETALLGDVVVCAPVVAAEAVQQGKPLQAHWAHLVIHGVLHLQGYDHHGDVEAQRMEALESKLLARLGYPDPWRAGVPA